MVSNIEKNHPSDSFLNADSLPSVWCPGCGIGTTANTFIEAIKGANINPDKICVISGIGCTGEITKCLKVKTYSIEDGSAVDYAVRLKKDNQDLSVTVFLNNADFLLSGAKNFIEASKKKADITVIYINNCVYTLSKGLAFPMTPYMRMSFDNKFELPFNISYLAKSSGAVYVARWTPLSVGWLKYSMIEAFSARGFSVVEVVTPCLVYCANSGKILDAVDQMKFYIENFEVKHHEPTENLDLRLGSKIITGKFVDLK